MKSLGCRGASLVLCGLLSVPASAEFLTLEHMPAGNGPAGDEAREISEQLQHTEALESAVALINELFDTEPLVTLRMGAEDGPLFDGEQRRIDIPYAFITDVRTRFRAAEAFSEEELVTVSDDVLLHTLFHEVAHALIDVYDIPVLGREEDAADGLATVLLIEYFEGGHEIALTAAQMFQLESPPTAALEAADFWGEHSLDQQRFYQLLCHVYGSAPEQFADLMEEQGVEPERLEQCETEYEQLVASWQALLAPVSDKFLSEPLQ